MKKTYSAVILLYYTTLLQAFTKLAVDQEPFKQQNHLQINLKNVEELNTKYPGLFSPKQMRVIRTRIAVMRSGVSVLMLLGKSRDTRCKIDPTFCVGQAIANVTQFRFGYIDASDPYLHSDEILHGLKNALVVGKPVIFDNLEKLPGTEVMNLFQFIDKDETNQIRGMLLFIVYTGLESEKKYHKAKGAEVAEKILTDKWSSFIPSDSLTSVISRMCGSVIKVK